MSDTVQVVVRHGYLLIFLWLLAEQAALPVPSVPLLLVSGALARTGALKLSSVITYALAACLIADNVWFQLGRRYSARALQFICKMSLNSCVRRTENVFVKYGLRSLLLSKFIPGLNVVAAPLAGGSGASFGRFLLFDSLGALIWITSYVFPDTFSVINLNLRSAMPSEWDPGSFSSPSVHSRHGSHGSSCGNTAGCLIWHASAIWSGSPSECRRTRFRFDPHKFGLTCGVTQ